MTSRNIILSTAQKTIDIEIQSLKNIVFDEHFIKTVEIIAQNNARIVLTGIGKSAIVAQKIAATLNSTGSPSVFMHAADAIHGDLGIIQPQDVVICLSKSGDTPEIKVLIPLVKNFGNTLIGIVSNRNSYLGTHADFILHTPIEQEADPNNLAPTASTTSQMAMGDALAMALVAIKGFTSQDFARFHPGGALGKQLYLRVRDLVALHTPPSVSLDASLQQTILEMTTKRLGATVVLDENQNVLGIITDGDLRRMLTKENIDFQHVTAKNILSPNPKTIVADALAVEALEKMRQASITQLVVINDEKERKYLGMVHLHDLLKEGLI